MSLDELLAAHAACEDRLGALMGRYSGSVVPASIMGADAAEVRKPTKRDRKEGIRSAFKPGGRLQSHVGSADRRIALSRLRSHLDRRAQQREESEHSYEEQCPWLM